MKYMGSKARLAKHILPIILKDRRPGQLYVEPFVGGGNSIQFVDGPRIGYDIDPEAIYALEVIRDYPEILPRDASKFTLEDYRNAKADECSALKGYAAFPLSYGGKKWGGFSQKPNSTRDYVAEAYRNAVAQSPRLCGCRLHCASYDSLSFGSAIIYCDPPYAGTTGYSTSFDSDTFWQWCREQRKLGNSVFISEYNAPSDFQMVFEREIANTMNHAASSKKAKDTEKLFTLP